MLEHGRLRSGRRAAREEQDRGELGRVGERALGPTFGVDPMRAGSDRRRDPREELVERRVGETVVQRRVAHAGPRGAEERGGDDGAVRLDEREVRCP